MHHHVNHSPLLCRQPLYVMQGRYFYTCCFMINELVELSWDMYELFVPYKQHNLCGNWSSIWHLLRSVLLLLAIMQVYKPLAISKSCNVCVNLWLLVHQINWWAEEKPSINTDKSCQYPPDVFKQIDVQVFVWTLCTCSASLAAMFHNVCFTVQHCSCVCCVGWVCAANQEKEKLKFHSWFMSLV